MAVTNPLRRTASRIMGERAATDPILVIAAIAVSLVLLVGGSFAVAGIIANGHDLNARDTLDKIAAAETSARADGGNYLDYDSAGSHAERALERAAVGFTPADGVRAVATVCPAPVDAWVAAAKSATGTIYVRSSESARTEKAGTPGMPLPCAIDLTNLGGDSGEPVADARAIELTRCRADSPSAPTQVGSLAELTAAVAAADGIVQLTADIDSLRDAASGHGLSIGPARNVTIDLNGHTLRLSGEIGLYVPSTTTLTITDSSTGGQLEATGLRSGHAGIGGGSSASISAGTINIECGTVTATSGDLGAGIGAGQNRAYVAVNISGGIVTAHAIGATAVSGSGIGPARGTKPADVGPITITGGIVTATAKSIYAWGIGRGSDAISAALGPQAPMNLTGGTINGFPFPITGTPVVRVSNIPELEAAQRAAQELPGIDAAEFRLDADIAGETITTRAQLTTILNLNGHNATFTNTTDYPGIFVVAGSTFTVRDSRGGGVLNAQGGAGAAGIGGRYSTPIAGTIRIESGTVNATGGPGGSGIGSGRSNGFEAIQIVGGTINATAPNSLGRSGAAIGTGLGVTTNLGSVSISGGRIETFGAPLHGRDIGAGDPTAGTTVASVPVSITAGQVNGIVYPISGASVVPVTSAEQIKERLRQAGHLPGITELVLRLDNDITGTPLRTTAGQNVTIDLNGHHGTFADASNGNDPGIFPVAGSTLTIRDSRGGGQLTAQGGANAAGIGGRYSTPEAGTIRIESGTINAIGGTGGPGIGGGRGHGYTAIIITGGNITATGTPLIGGGRGPAGIGGALGGTGLGTITISGGTITATASGVYAQAIGAGDPTAGTTLAPVTVTITGGTINGVAH